MPAVTGSPSATPTATTEPGIRADQLGIAVFAVRAGTGVLAHFLEHHRPAATGIEARSDDPTRRRDSPAVLRQW